MVRSVAADWAKSPLWRSPDLLSLPPLSLSLCLFKEWRKIYGYYGRTNKRNRAKNYDTAKFSQKFESTIRETIRDTIHPRTTCTWKNVVLARSQVVVVPWRNDSSMNSSWTPRICLLNARRYCLAVIYHRFSRIFMLLRTIAVFADCLR